MQERAGARTWQWHGLSEVFWGVPYLTQQEFCKAKTAENTRVPAKWHAIYRLRGKTLYTCQEESTLEETVNSAPALKPQSSNLYMINYLHCLLCHAFREHMVHRYIRKCFTRTFSVASLDMNLEIIFTFNSWALLCKDRNIDITSSLHLLFIFMGICEWICVHVCV